MAHYLVFQRTALDREVVRDSGYPWTVLLLAPLWAFGKGLNLHGAVLAVLYGACVLLMKTATDGLLVGAALWLCLGAFSAHNATDWLASSLVRRGYKRAGTVEASSVNDALRRSRAPKRPTVLVERFDMGAITDHPR